MQMTKQNLTFVHVMKKSQFFYANAMHKKEIDTPLCKYVVTEAFL